MSNASDKLAIANIALLSVTEKTLTSLSSNTPNAVKINGIIENVIKEVMNDDWHFNRTRVLLSDMTAINKLTVDSSPAPSPFIVGSTLTGADSGSTAVVVKRLSPTVYHITEPSADFTDGEVISDGTNSLDTATGFPTVSEVLDYGSYSFGYLKPTDSLYIRGVRDFDFDSAKYPYTPEGRVIYTNRTQDYFHYNKYVGENDSLTVSDVTQTPLWFHRLISARIAYYLAPNVTENQRRESKVEAEWLDAWLTAKEQNGNEAYNEFEQGTQDWAFGANNELERLG